MHKEAASAISINNRATLCLQIICLQIICVQILSVCEFSVSPGTLATHSLEIGSWGGGHSPMNYASTMMTKITAVVRMDAPVTRRIMVERECSASAPPHFHATSQAKATPQSPRKA